jgi:hypothetical protein
VVRRRAINPPIPGTSDVHRNLSQHHKALAVRPGGDGSADSRCPLGHPAQPVPWLRRFRAATVVADPQRQHAVPAIEVDGQPAGPRGVPDDVGDRLLRDPERGAVHQRRQRAGRAAQRDVQAGRLTGPDQLGQPVQADRR